MSSLFETPRISIIGAGTCDEQTFNLAYTLGKQLAEQGFTIVCGGLGGVMEAACKGASETGGKTIGLLPGTDPREANPYLSTVIATGLGHMRNYLVVLNGDLVVALEGGSGTLSEIGLALKIKKQVIAYGMWASVPGVMAAQTPEEIMHHIRSCMES